MDGIIRRVLIRVELNLIPLSEEGLIPFETEGAKQVTDTQLET